MILTGKREMGNSIQIFEIKLREAGEEISISIDTIKRDGNGSNQCDFISYANI